MPMMITRKQYCEEGRTPGCAWTEDAIAKALGDRFPGDDPIALEDVLQAWIDDARLPQRTLRHAYSMACRLLRKAPTGAWSPLTDPRELLRGLHAQLTAEPEEE